MDVSFLKTTTNSSGTSAEPHKTNDNHHITPSSPTNTHSTITQSISNSNSVSTASTSPPQPITPPRSSRSRTRYPELGRVPLHRRGTSQTYERLEDLLREAGYKETRVFTPETDRSDANASERDDKANKRTNVRGGVGAIVGYLAGLMPSAMSSRTSLHLNQEDGLLAGAEATRKSTHAYSPSVSPIAQRQPQRQATSSSSELHSPSLLTSSSESLDPTPRPSRYNPSSRPPTPIQTNSFHSPSSSTQDLHRPRLAHRVSDHSSSSSRPLQNSQHALQSPRRQPGIYLTPPPPPQHPPGPSQPPITHPRPSRAGAYLRHMASAPNMPKRPSSSPVHVLPQPHRKTLVFTDSDHETTQHRVRVRNENRATPDPPLPQTWIETVARAVLFGGKGAYLGGPPPSSSSARVGVASSSSGDSLNTGQRRALRPTRSSISQVSPRHLRPGLSDRTNNAGGGGARRRRGGDRDVGLAPPELFTRIERGRAVMSAGEVSCTRVVCRSAPVSRAGSPEAGGGGGGKERRKGRGHGKEREGGRGKGKKGGRLEEKDKVPSLANTNVEGDAWDRDKDGGADRGGGKGVERSGKNRYLSGWGVDVHSSGESSSDEEGELNLARMLVPPKRQNSIKSLRKHLAVAAHDGAPGRWVGRRAAQRGVSGSGVAAAAASGRASRTGSLRHKIYGDEDWYGSEVEEWGRGWVRRGMKTGNSVDDEDEESYAAGLLAGGRGEGRMFGSGRSTAGKTRSGLPGPWAFIGGGGS